jgi:antitoxin (DNA-binding transcriptional repressor) of toxin-antitoxin stability system
MTKIINLKDLRLNMDDYIFKVKKGASFIVMRKSVVVFLISPFDSDDIELVRQNSKTFRNKKSRC